MVYQFARQADDLADEGDITPEQRTKNLEHYETKFVNCLNAKYESGFWRVLGNTISEFKLSPGYFHDLLSAFRQDLYKKRYLTFDELLDYCKRSANPVGRIVLELFSIRDSDSLLYSDAICTALQLTNFYQDVSIDIKKGRIYIPLNELQKFGISESQFEFMENNTNFEQLVRYQVERAKQLFAEGRKLIPRLPKGLKRQIRMTILGGEKILLKIEKMNYAVAASRPKLSRLDYVNIFFRTLV